jgi:hypothetical protein
MGSEYACAAFGVFVGTNWEVTKVISRTNFRAGLVAVLSVIVLAGLTATAQADIYPVPGGGTSDATTGGHGDLTVNGTFTYSNANEDLRRVVIDTPTGGVGNPNAVPFADRCLKDTFKTGVCDDKALIGEVKLKVIVSGLPLDLTGKIYILQTTPEVPTEVGAYIPAPVPGLTEAIRANAVFYPVTEGPDGDLRIRSVTEPFPRTTKVLGVATPIQVTFYQQKLFGKLANGNVFITNPTRCDTWNSYGYLEAYDSNTNADADPLMEGQNTFVKTAAYPTTPKCDTLAPFNTTATAQVNGPTRGGPAAYSTELTIPNLGAEPQSPATPKTVVATLPDALNVDVQQLGRICSNEDFAKLSCPANSKVGSAAITTPMIVAGLAGDAYLVKASPGHNLPDLGVIARGAINFSVRGTNRYVNVSQLQTTFDNIPQVGFSSFKLNIAGGTNGLLLLDRCPTNGTDPADGGPTRFDMTSYQGQKLTVNSAKYTPPSCVSYSVKAKNITKCLKKRTLSMSPTIKSRKQVRYVKFYVNNKYVKKDKKSPFKAKVKLSSKLKAGKTYKYKVKVYFKPTAANPKGRVVTKTGKFKICK